MNVLDVEQFFKHPARCAAGDRICLCVMKKVTYHTNVTAYNLHWARDITDSEMNAVAVALSGNKHDIENETIRFKLSFLSGTILKMIATWRKARRQRNESIDLRIVVFCVSGFTGDVENMLLSLYGPDVLRLVEDKGFSISTVINAEVISQVQRMCATCMAVHA